MAGVVRKHPDGSASLVTNQGPGLSEVTISPRDARDLAHGARIRARVVLGRGKRWRAIPALDEPPPLAAGLLTRRGSAFVVEGSAGQRVEIRGSELHRARVGDVVAIAYDARGPRVTEVLGTAGEPKAELALLTHNLGLSEHFPAEAAREAERAPAVDVQHALAEGRRDLRDVPHVTIDGVDAKDFDDAVAARREPGGIRVWVSIADVSHYVRANTALDREARERATSVYLAHRVVPMLPEALSNNLCSLVPNQPRLTLTCEWVMDPSGKRRDVQVYPSLIRSHARRTYEEVQAAFDAQEVHDASLAAVREAAGWARAQRRTRGALDLDLPEIKVKVNPQNEPEALELRPRFEAHRVIEDLMVAANEAVAEYLLARAQPTLFRVHEDPNPQKLERFATFAARFGVHVEHHDHYEPVHVAAWSRALDQTPLASVGHMLLLRSLAQARYAPENLGHFGLASKAYLHFTSPIRRYPDLIVHRSLRALWQGEKTQGDLEPLALHCSARERDAIEAERKVAQFFTCQLAAEHVGELMDGVITGAHKVGVFVRTSPLPFEGLIPIATLGSRNGDYYDFVEDDQALVGRRSGHRVGVGDSVRVRLTNSSLAQRTIDFAIDRHAPLTPQGSSAAQRLAQRRTEAKPERARPEPRRGQRRGPKRSKRRR